MKSLLGQRSIFLIDSNDWESMSGEILLQTTRDKPREYIMALRFSNTEALSRPIDHKTLAQFLVKESGKRPVFRSPQTISARAFDRLYSFGHGMKESI